MNEVTQTILTLLATLSLLGGVFFMFLGALGVLRLPDFYSRVHAASKCITLGIIGVLLALVFHISIGPVESAREQTETARIERAGAVAAGTKTVLVIVFIFVASPVGSHMLSRAAHLAGVKEWKGTLSDELDVDRHADSSEWANRVQADALARNGDTAAPPPPAPDQII